MMHVAQAGESKGRVLLQLCSSAPNSAAIEAAVWIARAFQSEIESLYVEDEQLLELTNFPFVREISLTGRSRRTLTATQIERHFRYTSAEFHSRIASIAMTAEVPFKPRVMRCDPLSAIAAACSEHGPWNVVVLAEPFTSPACPPLKSLFEKVTDATGVLLVGPFSKRASGRIVIVLERAETLSAMLSAADRLASAENGQIALFMTAEGPEALSELESAARLALEDRSDVAVFTHDCSRNSFAASAEALRRLQPGLIIGEFGGVLVPTEGNLKPLAEALECPLLLVR